MERTSAPYRAGLRHLGDVTRDPAYPPKIAQFRIEMRAAAQWLESRLPRRLTPHTSFLVASPIRTGLRLWDIVLLSVAIQMGHAPAARARFSSREPRRAAQQHSSRASDRSDCALRFSHSARTFVWIRFAVLLAKALGFLTGLLLATIGWFSRLPRVSYRIPGPPLWLVLLFFAALIVLAASARARRSAPAESDHPAPAASPDRRDRMGIGNHFGCARAARRLLSVFAKPAPRESSKWMCSMLDRATQFSPRFQTGAPC